MMKPRQSKVEQAAGLRRGEIAHEPEGGAAEIVAGKCGHQEHDHGREERGRDYAAEEERGAVNLSVATAKKKDGGDSEGRADERANRGDEPCHFGRKIQMAFGDEGNDGAESGTGRNAEHIGIRKWIAQERLETSAGDGERRTDYDAEKNSRQANVQHDHAVVAGKSAGAVQEHADQIFAQTVERDLDGAELQRNNHNRKQNGGKNAAA